MEKDVLVSVIGIQSDMSSKDKEEIELITKGKYYEKGNKKYITYKESNMDSSEDTLSTVKVEKNRVTVSKIGTNNSSMLFEVGKKHVSYYATPYGSLELGITTRSMDVKFEEDKGEINISYLLEVNNKSVGVNDILIKVQNDKNKFKLV